MKEAAVKAHFDNNCFATFTQKKIGGVLEIPENTFLKAEAKQYLYEIDDNLLNVYIHGIKSKTHKIPSYAVRPYIMMEMICAIANMGMSPLLLRVVDDNQTEIPNRTDDVLTTKRAVELLEKPKQRKQQALETELFSAIDEFVVNGDVGKVNEDIIEGFELISNNYLDKIEL